MDQRRVIAFVAISTLVLILFAPKQQPRKKPAPEAAQPAEAADAKADLLPPPVEQPAPVGDLQDDKPQADTPLEFVSLGSASKDSPYRLLVTFTNQGAAVRRVELASPRFRDLHDRSGYLGHLELVADQASGLLVQTVGSGTPAAEAGLKKGDRILAAKNAGQPTAFDTPEEFADLLAKSEPGQTITLSVSRDGAPPVDRVITLARRPLEVIRPESENVLMRTDKLPAGFVEPPSFQFTFERLGTAKIGKDAAEIVGVELRESNWEIADRNATSVTFRRQLPQYGLEILKRYRLEPVPDDQLVNPNYPGYGLTLELEVRNRSPEALDVVYRLDGPNGLPLEGWWYANKIGRNWGAAGLRDVVARYEGSDTVQFSPADIATDDVEPMQGPPLAFIGVDAQYFSAVMLPIKPSLSEEWIDEARAILLGPKPKRPAERRFANVTCRLISHPQKIEAGGSLQHAYQIFTGPKRPDLLAQYRACGTTQYTLGDLMYYGWFGGVAKIMLAILHFFYGFAHNYGVAIILLTVLVRSCMFPISRKQAQSMAKMQLLKPEMDRLKEKYKNDMQKQSQAMQELYRKHQINPLAGCLPMFLQLPIFLGLYRALMVDVELRQAPLLGDAIRWCSNLAAPDMLLDWSAVMPRFINNGEGITGLGPYLNVLPLVTVVLFLLQQKMFMPEPANEQAAMQQKIMKFMMLFMGLLFFKVASGLCLYFIASSMWGIAERKFLPKPATPGETEALGPEKKKYVDTRGTKNGQVKGKRAKKKSKKKR